MGRRQCNRARPRDKISTQRCGGTDQATGIRAARDSLEDRHGSISTTLNIYTHVVDASHRLAIEAVERQLFPTVPKSQEPDTSSDPVSVTKRAG